MSQSTLLPFWLMSTSVEFWSSGTGWRIYLQTRPGDEAGRLKARPRYGSTRRGLCPCILCLSPASWTPSTPSPGQQLLGPRFFLSGTDGHDGDRRVETDMRARCIGNITAAPSHRSTNSPQFTQKAPLHCCLGRPALKESHSHHVYRSVGRRTAVCQPYCPRSRCSDDIAGRASPSMSSTMLLPKTI